MTNGLIAEGRPVRKWAAAALISYYYYRYFPKIFSYLRSGPDRSARSARFIHHCPVNIGSSSGPRCALWTSLNMGLVLEKPRPMIKHD